MSNLGNIVAQIQSNTAPTKTYVRWIDTSVSPNVAKLYNGVEWYPEEGFTRVNLAVPAVNFAMDFRVGKKQYRGTVNANITISFDATNAVDGMVRQAIFIGSGGNTVTLSSDFQTVSQNTYNGGTGVKNLFSFQYFQGVGIIYEVTQLP